MELADLRIAVDEARAAVKDARLTSIRLWRLAVIDDRASTADARDADARLACAEALLADAEKAYADAVDAAERLQSAEMRIAEVLQKARKTLRMHDLRDAVDVPPSLFSRAVKELVANKTIVRTAAGFTLARA